MNHDQAVTAAGAALAAARQGQAEATENLRVAVVAACTDGMPEQRAARLAGVNRMTIRKWMGK